MIDHHVDRPGVQARQRAELTGPNRPTGSRSHALAKAGAPPCAAVSHTVTDGRACCSGHRPHRSQALGTRRDTHQNLVQLPTLRPCRGVPDGHGALGAQRAQPAPPVGWTTWWLWRGRRTRSHPELGREMPQRPWYCVPRRGRVGRRQVIQPRDPRIKPGHRTPTYQRGVEQPGSSSGS